MEIKRRVSLTRRTTLGMTQPSDVQQTLTRFEETRTSRNSQDSSLDDDGRKKFMQNSPFEVCYRVAEEVQYKSAEIFAIS
jgi:hypothetical protein